MISFILPIKNRHKNLVRLIKNCKEVFKNIRYEIVIVDASSNLISKKNRLFLKKYKNIKYYKQKSQRITRGCFEVIKYLKYQIVTFLYDDDVMGPEVKKIYINFFKKNIFSMGTGIVIDQENKNYKFKKIKKIQISKDILLLNYFGLPLSKTDIRFKNTLSSPVSPICTCFTKKFLQEWKKKIKKFVRGNEFRNYYLLDLDIGPDLLTYLININKEKKQIHYYLPPSVRFSSHQESISVIYGKNNLRIGYWLPRIFFIEREKNYNKKILNKTYTYLLFIGFCLLVINIFNDFNRKNIYLELLTLIRNKNYVFSLNYLFKILNILLLK